MQKLLKNKILLSIIILIAGCIVISNNVSSETHSDAYNKRVNQLLKLDHIYKNKDGKIGGVFKLSDDKTARIYGVAEDGTVYVIYDGEVRPYSNKELDMYINRTLSEE